MIKITNVKDNCIVKIKIWNKFNTLKFIKIIVFENLDIFKIFF